MAKDDIIDKQVGYKNPPTKTQFKKGHSGNPGGKQKKSSMNFDDLLVAQMEAHIANNNITVLELILSRTIKTAVGGDMKATKLLFEAYIAAKSVRKHAASDEDADREAAKRVFDLDPRYFTDATGPKAQSSETLDEVFDKTNNEDDGS